MPVLPSATTTLSGLSDWAQPIFNSLLPYAYFAGGVLLGVGIILFLIFITTMVVHHLRGN